MMEKDFQKNRLLLSNGPLIKNLKDINKDSRVLCGNFGYIIIPNNKNEYVKKYYIEYQFYKRELTNYNLLSSRGILVPKIIDIGEVQIGEDKLFLIELENIRKHKKGYISFKDIEINKLSNLLGELHSINFEDGMVYAHGNLHFSNFFENDKKQLGIFDLVSMSRNYIEYDIASLYFHSGFNEDFLLKVINNYKYKNFISYKKIYYFALLKVKQNITFSNNKDYASKKGLINTFNYLLKKLKNN